MTTTLGERVRNMRKEHGWSARELSERAVAAGGKPVSRSSIAELESGRRKDMSLTAAVGIAGAFGISVEQLADTSVPPQALVVATEIANARNRLAEMLA